MTICERHGRLRCGECAYVEELKEEVESLQQQVKTLQKEQGWISVKDRLPDVGSRVLVISADGLQSVAEYRGKHFIDDHGWGIPKTTHWQPLPEPPKEE